MNRQRGQGGRFASKKASAQDESQLGHDSFNINHVM